MKINLQTDGTSSEEHMKLVYNLVAEMLYDYKMPAKSLINFLLVKENTVALAEWVKEKRGITMTHFCFPSNDNSFLAYGFDLLEDKYLTEYTMQLDLTKPISVKI